MRGLFWGIAAILLLMPESCLALAANDVFNPYRHDMLATSSVMAETDKRLLDQIGGQRYSLQQEVRFRPHWKSEVYPIIFGDPDAPGEILVFLDYAVPQSQKLWQELMLASHSLDPRQVKIVIMGKSREKYAIELMGGAIWLARQQPKLVFDYFRLTLDRWNSMKQLQRQREGKARPFHYEYDAVAAPTDYPILYIALKQLLPTISEDAQRTLFKDAYNAGNVNCYQAVDAARYYDVKSFPAVVVNGRLLSSPAAAQIVAATR